MKITRDITIEDLVEGVPQSVKYLMNKGIKCIACGEPIWGTLEDAAKEKGFSDQDIEKFVEELQEFADNPSKKVEEPESRVNVKDLNEGRKDNQH
jgi:methionine synthase II (cobalamin-independent)